MYKGVGGVCIADFLIFLKYLMKIFMGYLKNGAGRGGGGGGGGG